MLVMRASAGKGGSAAGAGTTGDDKAGGGGNVGITIVVTRPASTSSPVIATEVGATVAAGVGGVARPLPRSDNGCAEALADKSANTSGAATATRPALANTSTSSTAHCQVRITEYSSSGRGPQPHGSFTSLARRSSKLTDSPPFVRSRM